MLRLRSPKGQKGQKNWIVRNSYLNTNQKEFLGYQAYLWSYTHLTRGILSWDKLYLIRGHLTEERTFKRHFRSWPKCGSVSKVSSPFRSDKGYGEWCTGLHCSENKENLFQWWRDVFRCRIDLLNFSMGFNIIAPYMEFLHLNWYIAEWFVLVLVSFASYLKWPLIWSFNCLICS